MENIWETQTAVFLLWWHSCNFRLSKARFNQICFCSRCESHIRGLSIKICPLQIQLYLLKSLPRTNIMQAGQIRKTQAMHRNNPTIKQRPLLGLFWQIWWREKFKWSCRVARLKQTVGGVRRITVVWVNVNWRRERQEAAKHHHRQLTLELALPVFVKISNPSLF